MPKTKNSPVTLKENLVNVATIGEPSSDDKSVLCECHVFQTTCELPQTITVEQR